MLERREGRREGSDVYGIVFTSGGKAELRDVSVHFQTGLSCARSCGSSSLFEMLNQLLLHENRGKKHTFIQMNSFPLLTH